MGGLGASWGVVLADSGSQARLGRRPGRLVGDFGGLDGPNLGPKMASSWGLDRTKIDANIARIFDAFENRNLDGRNAVSIRFDSASSSSRRCFDVFGIFPLTLW